MRNAEVYLANGDDVIYFKRVESVVLMNGILVVTYLFGDAKIERVFNFDHVQSYEVIDQRADTPTCSPTTTEND